MTAVNMVWGPSNMLDFTANGTTAVALNDSDNACMSQISIPRDGTIDQIGIHVSVFNGTPPAFNVGIFNLTTGGDPDTASAYGGSAVHSWTPGGTGFVWVTLATPATANAGDIVALYLYPGGTPPDGTHNISVIWRWSSDGNSQNLPRGSFTSSWTKGAQRYGGLAARYDDDSVVEFVPPIIAIAETAYNTGSTDDEIGCIFQLPYAMTCTGAQVALALAADTNTADVILYDSANNILESVSLTGKHTTSSAATPRTVLVHWSDPVSLSANTDYRLVVKPTSANNVEIWEFEFPDAESRVAVLEGSRWQHTRRADAGSWTNTTTKLVCAGIVISDIAASMAVVLNLRMMMGFGS